MNLQAPFGVLYKLKYIKIIEIVQRRATELIPALKGVSYEER